MRNAVLAALFPLLSFACSPVECARVGRVRPNGDDGADHAAARYVEADVSACEIPPVLRARLTVVGGPAWTVPLEPRTCTVSLEAFGPSTPLQGAWILALEAWDEALVEWVLVDELRVPGDVVVDGVPVEASTGLVLTHPQADGPWIAELPSPPC